MRGQRLISWGVLLVVIVTMTVASPAQGQANRPAATVGGAVVNIRRGPGTDHSVIGQVRRGAVLTVSGRNQDASWLQVCCVATQTGWIYRPLVVLEGDLRDVPVIGTTPAPPVRPDEWQAEYFANRNLSGTPTIVRTDPQLNFRWNGASPAPNIPGVNFSVRWTRTASFVAGDYQFYAQADDGVRVYVDGVLLINQWRVGSATAFNSVLRGLSAGSHRITVEYFQASGDSTLVFWWNRADQFAGWRGEYFSDIYLAGQPILVRDDPKIDFNWSLGAPDPQVPADNFSVRWTRQINFDGGDYEFSARTSDGVRIYIDGLKVLDEWHDTVTGYPTYQGRFYELSAGTHTVTVEYYERGGIAYAMVFWNKITDPRVPR